MAKRNRVYIAGPITGTDDYMERFAAAEAKLQKEGNLVVNPTAFSAHLLNAEFDWAEFMSVTLTLMSMCDKVYLLPGWKNSKGCRCEVKEAKKIGMPIWYAEK